MKEPKKYLWVHEKVYTDLFKTGEYKNCLEEIPVDLIFFGTRAELKSLAAKVSDWKPFKEVQFKQRKVCKCK